MTLGVALALASTLVLPGITADTPILDVPLNVDYFESFDENAGNWTASDVPDVSRPVDRPSWAWGAPTSGPGVAASGENVWATNLHGAYNVNECAGLMTPPLDLTSATTATVTFTQWRAFEGGSTISWDGGLLFVTRDDGKTLDLVTPEGGYPSPNLASTARDCLNDQSSGQRAFGGTSAGYETVTVSLDDFVGDSVRFVIAFGADGSGLRDGWYVDDFTLQSDAGAFAEDFEEDDGGFSVVGVRPVENDPPTGWEHGTTDDRVDAASALWATNLDGAYGAQECAWIESPAFQVGDADLAMNPLARATLSWSQFFQSRELWAGGVVQIGTGDGKFVNVEPEGGYPEPRYGELTGNLDACLEHVTQGTGAFSGWLSDTGSGLTEYQADVTAFIGQTVTVRFLFASDWTWTSGGGWYVDDVRVESGLYAAGPDVPDAEDTLAPTLENATTLTDTVLGALPQPRDLLPAPSFTADDWTIGGARTTWEYGTATTGPVNDTAFGTNLDDDYLPTECGWIESPNVATADVWDNVLEFEHWVNAENNYDGGALLVSTNGGGNWSFVHSDAYTGNAGSSLRNCVNGVVDDRVGYGTGAFTGATSGWETVSLDLTPFLEDAEEVRFRFVFGSDTSVQKDGWFLRSANLGGATLL